MISSQWRFGPVFNGKVSQAGVVGSAAFATTLPSAAPLIGGRDPERLTLPRGLHAPHKRAGVPCIGFQPSPPANGWTGNRTLIVYAVSIIIFCGKTSCPPYRFHPHQSDMVCRYRIDAVFRAFCRLTRERNALYYRLVVPRQMEPPILAASLRGCG